MTPIKAVIFDFDGVVVETEGCEYRAWREIWAGFDLDLSLDQWAPCIGTNQDATTFQPFEELSHRTGLVLDRGELEGRKRAIAEQLHSATEVLEGVVDWLDQASACGFPVAIASSSNRDWIESHLIRLGLRERFGVIACFDDCGVTKPNPASYRHACAKLGVTPAAALAVEDSRNGLLAAKAAGLTCVVVPTEMTAELDLSSADLILGSLGELSVTEVIAKLRPA